MTLFRACLDLHGGRVKQIVGSTLRDSGVEPETNFVAEEDAAWFARRYREDDLRDTHVIMLGPGNDEAARQALEAWPGAFQLGGGISPQNAEAWLDAGAGRLVVTSWLFEDGAFSLERARTLSRLVGRERLVIDLSCRRVANGWRVATDRWQTLTAFEITASALEQLAELCAEFLVHAADVEGTCSGIDEELVALLGDASPIPCTYAGGARALADLECVDTLSAGRVHLTFGSALDLFGGDGVRYADCVAWNRRVGASG